tara:strand:+ start:794 stop:1105 length:312 start_codon:yes stop_codon:yes gene_type:complete
MYKLKSENITAINPKLWKQFAFVTVDNDTYTDNDWNGCDYRINDSTANCDGLAIDIFITGKKSIWNGVTYQTAARIVFPNDGIEKDNHTSGIVYSIEPLSKPD